MINYYITINDLKRIIEQKKPNWLSRARKRTDLFCRIGKYQEESSIWSEIKEVFIELQFSKCAYCEKELEGKIEHDIEHFRPKSKLKKWSPPKRLTELGIRFTPISENDKNGYYLLAYNLLNYATACKYCNSILKKSYFPIAGIRNINCTNPRSMKSERPYLIYPNANIDTNPEDLIEFRGVSPRPASNDRFERYRAFVTITFFKLDDYRRKPLYRGRASAIIIIYMAYKLYQQSTSNAKRNYFHTIIRVTISSKNPHANCARSYYQLCTRNSQQAESLFQSAASFLESISL